MPVLLERIVHALRGRLELVRLRGTGIEVDLSRLGGKRKQTRAQRENATDNDRDEKEVSAPHTEVPVLGVTECTPRHGSSFHETAGYTQG